MIRNYVAAKVKGSNEFPKIVGTVTFRPMMNGTWVSANIVGLPDGDGFHGFHLHSGEVCDIANDYESAGPHYNPTNQAHPYHAGDFPPLLSCSGTAQLEFYTNRFTPQEIVGKTVIIHSHPDDFRTNPAGNSGARIACGVVRRV